MTDNSNADDIPRQALAPRSIDFAHRYFSNAKEFGQPGSPDMINASEIQSQHALMAQTAALVAIAESLEQIAQTNRISARRLQLLTQAMSTLSKDITKIRYSVR